MNCQIDGNKLLISKKDGIEIDYCPSCKGVWLDKGELDKIIKLSETSAEQTSSITKQRDNLSNNDSEYDKSGHRMNSHQNKKGKYSALSDLFDFQR